MTQIHVKMVKSEGNQKQEPEKQKMMHANFISIWGVLKIKHLDIKTLHGKDVPWGYKIMWVVISLIWTSSTKLSISWEFASRWHFARHSPPLSINRSSFIQCRPSKRKWTFYRIRWQKKQLFPTKKTTHNKKHQPIQQSQEQIFCTTFSACWEFI